MKKFYSLAFACLASLAFSQISLVALDTPYVQDFDGLSNTGTNNSTILSGTLAGWAITEAGSAANTSYSADNGSLNSGNTYSYGVAGSSDRALGALASNNLESRWGARFVNNTGAVINQLLVSYIGEQWRYGGSRSTLDNVNFEISTTATTLSNGTWSEVTALRYSSTDITGSAGIRNGNDTAYRTAVNGTITGLNIPVGGTFYIRFVDENVSGNDDGLAIDDFSLTPQNTGTLSAIDIRDSKNIFIKNTLVKNGEITFGTDAKNVKVYNMSGQIVKTASAKANETLNVAELVKGNYIVTGTVNNQPVSQKILKD